LSAAIVGTIWAVYLDSLIHNEAYVGLLSTLFTITAMIASVIIIPLMEKNSKSKIYLVSLILYTISYILLAVFSKISLIIVLGIFIAIISTLKITSFGIILRDKSSDTAVSKNIGLIYTFINLSWLLGPLIAGLMSKEFGIAKVFFLGAGFQALAFLLFISFRIKDNRTEKKIHHNPLKVLLEFLRNKDRLIVYLLSAGVSFWWALIYVYIPMKIVDSGLGNEKVGFFLFGVIIPLILFEYIFGKITAKKGFRKIFFTGYLILSIISLLCFFISNLYTILGLLIVASIGVSMIEPTTEAYFFDIITKNQRDRFYSQHNTAIDMGNIIATFFSAIILLFLPFKFIFILFGVVTFLLALVSLKTRNIIEGRR